MRPGTRYFNSSFLLGEFLSPHLQLRTAAGWGGFFTGALRFSVGIGNGWDSTAQYQQLSKGRALRRRPAAGRQSTRCNSLSSL